MIILPWILEVCRYLLGVLWNSWTAVYATDKGIPRDREVYMDKVIIVTWMEHLGKIKENDGLQSPYPSIWMAYEWTGAFAYFLMQEPRYLLLISK